MCGASGDIEENRKSLHRPSIHFYLEFPFRLSPDLTCRMNESWKHLWNIYTNTLKPNIGSCKMRLLPSIIHAMGEWYEENSDFFRFVAAAAAVNLLSVITIACAFWKSTYCVISYPLTAIHLLTHAQSNSRARGSHSLALALAVKRRIGIIHRNYNTSRKANDNNTFSSKNRLRWHFQSKDVGDQWPQNYEQNNLLFCPTDCLWFEFFILKSTESTENDTNSHFCYARFVFQHAESPQTHTHLPTPSFVLYLWSLSNSLLHSVENSPNNECTHKYLWIFRRGGIK